MITDRDIPTADPGKLILLLTPLLYKIMNRYRLMLAKLPAVDVDDLLQAGRVAIFLAQKKYDPDGGASFITFVFDRIRSAMHRTMKLKSDGSLPVIPESIDEPLSEDEDLTLLDTVADTEPTAEESIVAEDARQETAEAVHAAVDRLKNPKHRECIKRVWFDAQDKETAAAEMGYSVPVFRNTELQARYKLKRDPELKQFASLPYPLMRVGVDSFNSKWASSTEVTVLWRERHYDEVYGTGAFLAAGTHDHGRRQAYEQ